MITISHRQLSYLGRGLLLALLLMQVLPLSAQIYKYQTPKGKLLFTDKAIYKSGYALLNRDEIYQSRKNKAASRNTRKYSVKRFERDVLRISEQNGVDKSLILAIIKTESDFNPNAVSHAGAEGLMQLMPKTANAYQVYDSFNPVQNIRGGTEHIKYLLNKYDNNTIKALAAYNAGETAVNKYRGVPPFPETQRYIKKVLQFKKEFE